MFKGSGSYAPTLLISAGRAAALTALDCLPFVKKFVAKRMMFGANG